MIKPIMMALVLSILLIGCSMMRKSSGKNEPFSKSVIPTRIALTNTSSLPDSEANMTTILSPILPTTTPTQVVLPTTTPTQAVLPTTTPTQAVLLTATRSPTLMPSSITPTETNTQTPTSIVMNYHCLENSNSVPVTQTLQGILIFNNRDNTDAFLLDLKTGAQVRFPRKVGNRLFDFEVSPNGKRLLYRDSSKAGDLTIIATSNGQIIWSDPVWYGWFDNEHLSTLVTPEVGLPYVVFLNPFTGERRELHPDYPNLNMFNDSGLEWGGATTLPVYDPTLTRVVYPECDSNCHERLSHLEAGWPVVLWDIAKDKAIARLMTMDTYGNTPKWTNDGSQFIISADLLEKPSPFYRSFNADEFYLISRDGVIRQLTHFMDHFSASKIYNSYSLSPDGQFIAFWIEAKPDKQTGARLAVLNINTGNVTNYCIENITPDITVEPIWSPDSKQLLLNLPDPNNEAQRYAVIVDMANGWTAKIIENWMPMGWMVGP